MSSQHGRIVNPVLAGSACGLGVGREVMQAGGRQHLQSAAWVAQRPLIQPQTSAPLRARWQGHQDATPLEGLWYVRAVDGPASQQAQARAAGSLRGPGPPHPSRRHRTPPALPPPAAGVPGLGDHQIGVSPQRQGPAPRQQLAACATGRRARFARPLGPESCRRFFALLRQPSLEALPWNWSDLFF